MWHSSAHDRICADERTRGSFASTLSDGRRHARVMDWASTRGLKVIEDCGLCTGSRLGDERSAVRRRPTSFCQDPIISPRGGCSSLPRRSAHDGRYTMIRKNASRRRLRRPPTSTFRLCSASGPTGACRCSRGRLVQCKSFRPVSDPRALGDLLDVLSGVANLRVPVPGRHRSAFYNFYAYVECSG